MFVKNIKPKELGSTIKIRPVNIQDGFFYYN